MIEVDGKKVHTEETKKKISEGRKGKNLGNTNGFVKGMTPWNKGKEHKVHNDKWKSEVSNSMSGENHWNYKDGKRLGRKYKSREWSKAVRERDNFTCQMCGSKEKLVSHHIKEWDDNPDKRYDLENGLTLCRKCHCKIHLPRLGTGKQS